MQTHTKLILFGMISCMLLGHAPEVHAVTIDTSAGIAGIPHDVVVSDLPNGTTGIVHVLPPYGNAIEMNFTAANGTATTRLLSQYTEDAGIYRVSVIVDNEIIHEDTIRIAPSSFAASESSIETDTSFISVGANEPANITVTARDMYGNPIAGRPLKVVTGRNSDTIQMQTSETDADGQQYFTIRTNQPGIITPQAIDLISSDIISSNTYIQVDSMRNAAGGPVAQAPQSNSLNASLISGRALYGQVSTVNRIASFTFEVSASMKVNTDENITIVARDRNGQIVEDYEGTVLLSSTDPDAILPSFGSVTFNGSDLGRKQLVLGLRFLTPGEHILYGQDSEDKDVYGQTSITVTGRSTTVSNERITIISPIQNTVVTTSTVTVEGTGPAFINLIVSGGTRDVAGETDAEGNFSVTIPLDSTQTEHTITVASETGNAESNALTIITDVTAPEITSFEYNPTVPQVGTDILITITVKEEGSGIATTTLSINNEIVTLKETGTNAYSYVFTPKNDGPLSMLVSVADKAGNTKEVQSMAEVQKKPTPVVQNLQGKIENNIALLTWDEIKDVDMYRIYVGQTANEFSYTLETRVNEAKINGLIPGTVYYFAITAKLDGKESVEKSQTLVLESPRTTMTVVEKDGRLELQWKMPLSGTTISNYRLRYGIQADALSEERMLNGTLEAYTVENLLNNTKYFLELVPITVTGKILTEATMIANGTPSGSAFHGSASDPIPADILGKYGKEGKGKGEVITPDVPKLPDIGLPTSMVLISIFCAIIGVYTYIRYKEAREHRLFLEYMQAQYNS